MNVSHPFLNMGSKPNLTLHTAQIYSHTISIFYLKSNSN